MSDNAYITIQRRYVDGNPNAEISEHGSFVTYLDERVTLREFRYILEEDKRQELRGDFPYINPGKGGNPLTQPINTVTIRVCVKNTTLADANALRKADNHGQNSSYTWNEIILAGVAALKRQPMDAERFEE